MLTEKTDSPNDKLDKYTETTIFVPAKMIKVNNEKLVISHKKTLSTSTQTNFGFSPLSTYSQKKKKAIDKSQTIKNLTQDQNNNPDSQKIIVPALFTQMRKSVSQKITNLTLFPPKTSPESSPRPLLSSMKTKFKSKKMQSPRHKHIKLKRVLSQNQVILPPPDIIEKIITPIPHKKIKIKQNVTGVDDYLRKVALESPNNVNYENCMKVFF